MTGPACGDPIALDELLAYRQGELPPAEEDRVEAHVIGCDRCAGALEWLEEVREGVAALVRGGRVAAGATGDLLARAEAEGLRLRTYRVAPGEEVPCTAAPDDDYVVVRLAGDFGDARRIDVTLEGRHGDAAAGDVQRIEDAIVDRASGELVLLYPGERVRALPRTRWRYDVETRDAAGATRRHGPFRLDHTPWDELPPAR